MKRHLERKPREIKPAQLGLHDHPISKPIITAIQIVTAQINMSTSASITAGLLKHSSAKLFNLIHSTTAQFIQFPPFLSSNLQINCSENTGRLLLRDAATASSADLMRMGKRCFYGFVQQISKILLLKPNAARTSNIFERRNKYINYLGSCVIGHLTRNGRISKFRANPYNISIKIYSIWGRTCDAREFFSLPLAKPLGLIYQLFKDDLRLLWIKKKIGKKF